MSAIATVLPGRDSVKPFSVLIAFLLKTVYAALGAPAIPFLVTLAAMLFRPPDLNSFPSDRVALAALLASVAVRLSLRRERLHAHSVTWPLLALVLLGLWGTLGQAYDATAWSVLAAQWIVPFVLFHIAGLVFRDEASLHKLEVFSLAVLVYLTAISVFFIADFKSLIFPRFILDEGIGIHADRARGPFLQAVANGLSLNIFALVALHSFERRRLPRAIAGLLFLGVPLAILATRTRAVWLSAAVSVGMLVLGPSRRLRRIALALCALVALGFCSAALYEADSGGLTERLRDRSPVEFRLEMYRAGWQMFMEKPILGWGSQANIQPEIAKRVSDFHPDYYIFHNTYLELAVEHGLCGLGLYAWLLVCLFRLGKRRPSRDSWFLGAQFLPLWPIVLVVYLINASAVVMNYQFLNGFVFSIAGILAAQASAVRNNKTASIVSST